MVLECVYPDVTFRAVAGQYFYGVGPPAAATTIAQDPVNPGLYLLGTGGTVAVYGVTEDPSQPGTYPVRPSQTSLQPDPVTGGLYLIGV